MALSAVFLSGAAGAGETGLGEIRLEETGLDETGFDEAEFAMGFLPAALLYLFTIGSRRWQGQPAANSV